MERGGERERERERDGRGEGERGMVEGRKEEGKQKEMENSKS